MKHTMNNHLENNIIFALIILFLIFLDSYYNTKMFTLFILFMGAVTFPFILFKKHRKEAVAKIITIIIFLTLNFCFLFTVEEYTISKMEQKLLSKDFKNEKINTLLFKVIIIKDDSSKFAMLIGNGKKIFLTKSDKSSEIIKKVIED